jgi:transcription elongation factor GreB
MSKAFVKENQEVEEPEEDKEPSGLPAGSKNYMTPVGAERLRTELRQLLQVTRPEVVRTVSWAASNGDRSENGDYIYGKRRLREIDRRIRFLQRRLDQAEIVNPADQRGDRVLFGAKVLVEDEAGVRKTFRIVGIDEANPKIGDVSWISPIARALLNAQVGDVVQLRSPKGEEDLEVLKVEFS